jgi:glycosyltransferase involved in cell wall biosynthesis
VPYFPKAYVRYKIAKHTNYYYNRVAQVITPSEAAFTSLRRQSVMRPITVIPTGNPSVCKVDRAAARNHIGAREGEKVLLYVGRMAKEKNIILLLDAIAETLRDRADARLWMVGDGPDRTAAQTHARAIGIGDRVKCVGAIPRDEVDRYYSAADLFVFASTTETQGLVIGEAMTHGLPSVVARGGGASDNVEDDVTGLIVGSSVVDISNAVETLLQNPAKLGRLGESCRRHASSWTHSASCDSVLKVYREALRVRLEEPYGNIYSATH